MAYTVTNPNGTTSTYNLPSTSVVGPVVETYNAASGQSSYQTGPGSGNSGGGTSLASNSPQVQNYVANQNAYANQNNYVNPANGNQVMGANGPATNNTVNGIPTANQDFSINPNNKYADVSVSNTISGTTLAKASTVADKAQGIVNTAQSQTNAKQNVNQTLQDATQLGKQANTAFIQGAVMGALGRAASKDELTPGNQYSLVGLSVGDVAKKLGYNIPAQQVSQLPGANTSNPDSQNTPDPAITDLTTGLIDLQKFQTQYLNDWQTIVDKTNADATNLTNAKAQEAEGVQGINQQTGVEQGLLTGEAAAYKAQNDITIQTLTDLLGIDNQSKSDLQASGQLQMSMMSAANTLREQIYNQAKDLRSDQQQAFTNILDMAKVGAFDTTKLTPADTLQLSNMANAIGIPASTILDGLKSVQAQALLANTPVAKTTSKVSSSTSKATKFVLTTAIPEMSQAVQSQVGGEGFISKEDWATLLQQWNAAGGSTSSFVSNFKGYANPALGYDYQGIAKKTK